MTPSQAHRHFWVEGGDTTIQRSKNQLYDVSREFEDIYAMQVRRLGMELGAIYSEDHGRPILTNGERSVLFCLTNGMAWNGLVSEQKQSRFNKHVYSFQWSTPSIFDYPEFRRLGGMVVGGRSAKLPNFYPEMTLPRAYIDRLLRDHQLKLDGNLEATDDTHGFYIWIIDKGSGLFHFCVNSLHDALFFQPIKILVKETGEALRW